VQESIEGTYKFVDGAFVADAGMQAINERVQTMLLLRDRGEGRPSFYLDPSDGSYWELREFENYRKEFRKVELSYIRSEFPTVDPEQPL
jgi:hypothetical protein